MANMTRFMPGTQCKAVTSLGLLVWQNMPAIMAIINGIDPTDPNKTVQAFLQLKQQWIGPLTAAYPYQSQEQLVTAAGIPGSTSRTPTTA